MGNFRGLEENLDALWKKLKNVTKLGRKVIKQTGETMMEEWLEKVDQFDTDVEDIIREFEDLERGQGQTNQLALERKVTQRLQDGQDIEEEGKARLEQIMFLEKWNTKKLERFSERDLMRFTSDFSHEIGCGGYGKVFRGEFSDGRKIAVKVLDINMGGDLVEETFKIEVQTMATTVHRNLVTLHGYCFEVDLKALVYDFVENGSLDRILSEKESSIEFGELYDIAIETALGISYLHDGCPKQIIHYDIKPENVLINEILSPKLTDFGVAKLTNRDDTILNSRLRGTPGYIAPELMTGQAKVSYKSDVYSYGMLLFDILWRSNKTDEDESKTKHDQVRNKFKNEQELYQLLQQLGIDVNDWNKARELCRTALRCVQYAPESRPDMTEVVYKLKSVKDDKRVVARIAQTSKGKEAASGSKLMLESFQKCCPPGGENSVTVYTTTSRRSRKAFDASNEVRSILQSYKIEMEERDLYKKESYEQQLEKLLGKRVVVPAVFVKGWFIGGVDELVELEEEDALKYLLHGIPRSNKWVRRHGIARVDK